VTEAELQAAVIDLAHVYGWKVAHFRPAQTAKGWRTPVGADGKGFPDLLMVRDADLLAIELKTERGMNTPEQEAWLRAFLPIALLAAVWRPAEWENGTILATLKGDA
jgi:hypothetical protein